MQPAQAGTLCCIRSIGYWCHKTDELSKISTWMRNTWKRVKKLFHKQPHRFYVVYARYACCVLQSNIANAFIIWDGIWKAWRWMMLAGVRNSIQWINCTICNIMRTGARAWRQQRQTHSQYVHIACRCSAEVYAWAWAHAVKQKVNAIFIFADELIQITQGEGAVLCIRNPRTAAQKCNDRDGKRQKLSSQLSFFPINILLFVFISLFTWKYIFTSNCHLRPFYTV